MGRTLFTIKVGHWHKNIQALYNQLYTKAYVARNTDNDPQTYLNVWIRSAQTVRKRYVSLLASGTQNISYTIEIPIKRSRISTSASILELISPSYNMRWRDYDKI